MSTISDYYKEAELALAAYANLFPGMSAKDYTDALIDDGKGMSAAQAERFASTYTVVDQFTDPLSGLSATVFQQGATKYLAIRGSEGITDYIADYVILNGTPSYLNPQYLELKDKVQEWLDNGVLPSTFTVTGHSLGGYLAAGLLADFSANISHAYLYNAPGNNSPTSLILQALGIISTPDASRITNLRADAGISPISELGYDFSSPIPIVIENQFLSGVSDPPLSLNHSQRVLTNALAIYDLFTRVDPTVSVETVSAIIKAVSNENANTLESALSALGAIYGKGYTSIETDRDTFYANLYDLQEAVAGKTGTVVSLVGQSRDQLAGLAKADIAYRYALEELIPFAVTGNSGLYASHNADGHLDAEQFTDLYLQDRAAMLTWKMQFDSGGKDADDLLPGDKSYASDWDTWSIDDDWKFTDVSRNITLTIDGNGADMHRIVFGSDAGDTINGDSKADHLYGRGGDDILCGGDGDDHLEGNDGRDSLYGGSGVDTLYGGRDDDVLVGGSGDDLMIGGEGVDTYLIEGNDTIRDTGSNRIYYQGKRLAGGFVQVEGTTNVYRSISNDQFTLTFNSPGHLVLNGTDSITFENQTSAADFENDINTDLTWRMAA